MGCPCAITETVDNKAVAFEPVTLMRVDIYAVTLTTNCSVVLITGYYTVVAYCNGNKNTKTIQKMEQLINFVSDEKTVTFMFTRDKKKYEHSKLFFMFLL